MMSKCFPLSSSTGSLLDGISTSSIFEPDCEYVSSDDATTTDSQIEKQITTVGDIVDAVKQLTLLLYSFPVNQ